MPPPKPPHGFNEAETSPGTSLDDLGMPDKQETTPDLKAPPPRRPSGGGFAPPPVRAVSDGEDYVPPPVRSKGPPPEKPPSELKAKLKVWAKRLALASLIMFVVGMLVLGGLVWHYSRGLPKFKSIAEYQPRQSTQVFAADGTMVGEIFDDTGGEEEVGMKAGGRRTVVPYADIPAVMVQALISAEDKSFFEHAGVDPIGIAKAAIANLRPGSHKRGASTLTQQTVKTILLSSERTYSRKIKEAILAFRLESNLSKEDILYLYLNQIYFGARRYGIEEAARYYFGKGIKEIELTEAAVLASLPKSPIQMNPRNYGKRATQRRNYVLDQMAKNGYITKEVAEREIAKPIVLAPPPPPLMGGYYVEEAKRQLFEALGKEAVTDGGLRVELAMHPDLQRAAEKSVKEGLRALDKRQGYRGAVAHLDDAPWAAFKAKALAKHAENGENGREGWTEDAVLDLRRVDFKGITEHPEKAADYAKGAAWKLRELDAELIVRIDKVSAKGADVDLGTSIAWMPFTTSSWARKWDPGTFTIAPKSMTDVVKAGDLVLARITKLTPCTDKDKAAGCIGSKVEVVLEQNPAVESALVSIDPHTRQVLALVGGFDHKRSPFNRATQAKRQPGSSFKPFVVAAGLETGRFTPRTWVLDAPNPIRDPWNNTMWNPTNYEGEGLAGALTLRKALAESRNTVAVKMLELIGREPGFDMTSDDAQKRGLEKVKDLVKRAGIDSPVPDSLTAVLGSGELAPIEMVNAYTTLAAQGKFAKPILVKRVKAPDGRTLWENKYEYEVQPPMVPGQPALPPTGRGLRPEVAFVTAEIMRSVVEDPSGTAPSLRALGRTIYGKTGTASESRDAWFVGFTAEACTGVWVGFDDHTTIGARETGGRAAGPIWLNYMKVAEEKLPPQVYEAPLRVAKIRIDPRFPRDNYEKACIAEETSPFVEDEYFVEGTQPGLDPEDPAAGVCPAVDEKQTIDFFRDESP